MFDSNDTLFKYNAKMNAFSMIQADYLMKNRIQDKNVFLFLAKDKKTDYYFCRSFFPEGKRDYTRNQASWLGRVLILDMRGNPTKLGRVLMSYLGSQRSKT